jgi:hypothetical protein
MRVIMSMEYIRRFYSVPAKRGGRIEYTYNGKTSSGTILSADGAILRVRLDGDKRTVSLHPTYNVIYIDSGRTK